MEINRTTGTAIVLVEQNVATALRAVERAIVLKTGSVIFDGPSSELAQHEDLWRWF
jgi:branched-chain amino acid transport system ATP-binding protein